MAVAAVTVCGASAADFFSTDKCDRLFDLGVRVGMNTSNRTVDKEVLGGYNFQSWGTGFNAGVVADINIREYISIQPGVFFESRSGNCQFVTPVYTNGADGAGAVYETAYWLSQSAHLHTYNLTIPILASVRFNVTDNLRWMIEAGPYISFGLSSKLQNKEIVTTIPAELDVPMFAQDPAPVDFGFKFGTGLEFFGHYYVGVHYEFGVTKAWKDRTAGNLKYIYGGRTKAWLFTLGYNF